MAKNTFTLNDVVYTAKPFTYNLIADLDDMGVSIADAGNKPTSFIRGYVAVCAGISKEEAGEIIEAHIVSGGKLDAISNAMTKEMNASGFFQALTKGTPKKTSEN